MHCSRTDQGEQTILKIAGTLDQASAPELQLVVQQIVDEQRKDVVIDLSELDNIDNAGVTAVVGLYKRVHTDGGGQVKVTGLRDQPLAIFRLLRFDRVFGL